MAKKDMKTGLLGIIILVIGIVVGLVLIDQTQDFRNKAKEEIVKEYTVCHKEVVAGGTVWEEKNVSQDELTNHLNHGDILGNCPLENEN